MDVCDMKVTHEDGSLSRGMMNKAMSTFMKERIWINRVATARSCFSLSWRLQHSVAQCAWFTAREEPNLHPFLQLMSQTECGYLVNTDADLLLLFSFFFKVAEAAIV